MIKNCWGDIVFILLKRAVENGGALWYGVAEITVFSALQRAMEYGVIL